MISRFLIRSLSVVLLLSFISTTQVIAKDSEKAQHDVPEWLIAGPFNLALPAWHEVTNITGGTFRAADLLHFQHVDVASLAPVQGDDFFFNQHQRARWTLNNQPTFSAPDSENQFHVYYATTYLRASRWMQATLEVEGAQRFSVYVNGNRVTSKTSVDASDSEKTGNVTHALKLHQGLHTIVVKYMVEKGAENASLKASLKTIDPFNGAAQWQTSPQSPVTLRHLTDAPQPVNVSVSPDGSITAVMMREARPDENTWENWIELLRSDSRERIAVYRGGMQFSGMNWAPSGRIFSYTTRTSGKGTIWVVDLDRGTHEPVLRDVNRLGGHTWAPDGSFMIYSISEQFQPDGSGVSRLDGMHDRYPTWRTRSFLYRLNLPSGTRERLTAGVLSTSLNSISPDGKSIVFSRTHIDYSERPFSRAELLLMDLRTLETETLFEAPWVGGAQFSPDGKSLLLTGSPNAFGDVGRIVEGLANDYDSQAYIYDLATRQVRGITRELDRSVMSASWSADGRSVIVAAEDGSHARVFRIDLRNNRITRLNTGVDMASGLNVAARADRAVFIGHGINNPHKVYSIDLRRERTGLLYDPSAEHYRNVFFGTSKDWTFTTEDGTLIDGHVYYPVDFDPSKKYPVIVYYYGGTAPVTRAFSGRYPKELYAANGYLVYILQPSGSTGYGQEFAQRHLNDWGIRVSGEIIQGVEKFLDAHEYADRDRVGAMGASFGGFMTMLLLTETDIFATAVSHAGISNITSYWGEGFWGYLYSSVASANSFPWDAPHIYVDQSPIFRADRVNTPLLLVTGMSDTNVPPGESIQFYTALKLLGKEVEFIQVENQDHHIVDYNKFILWKNSILSWFDRWLKDEPEWWNDMHP